jgi:hypothetical protein
LEEWRLENDHAIPMDLVQRAASQTDPKLTRYSQLTESEFLHEVNAEIESRTTKDEAKCLINAVTGKVGSSTNFSGKECGT